MWKEAIVTYFMVLVQDLLGGTQENHEKLVEDTRHLGWESTWDL
jgi:hypothetical protein